MASNHSNWPWNVFGDEDPSAIGVAAPLGMLYLRRFTNPSTGRGIATVYQKIGPGDTDWILVGGASKQVFSYVAVGGEANPLTVSLPAARPDADYLVQVTMARRVANTIKAVSCISNTKTTVSFQVELSAALEADDELWFTVEDPT